MGVVNIRVLAGGALSASAARHPIASPAPAPIGSGSTYDADVARAQRLQPLIQEGHAANLIEASVRFVIANPRSARCWSAWRPSRSSKATSPRSPRVRYRAPR